LSRVIDFQKFTKAGWQSIDCPRVIATTYLARAGLWRVPQLKALATCPLLLDDGRTTSRRRPSLAPSSTRISASIRRPGLRLSSES
jgi:hypothetical protein